MAFFFKNTRTKVLPLLNLVRYLICSELVAESKADTMADTRINLGTTSSTRRSTVARTGTRSTKFKFSMGKQLCTQLRY